MNRNSVSPPSSDEAIEWLARLRAKDVTAAERGEFAVWLSRGENKANFDAALALWEQLEVLGTLDVPIPSSSKLGRWLPLATAASLILALLMTVVYQNLGDEFNTATGEQRRVVLQDGSTVHLNTNSTATVRLKNDKRYVKLESGEAYFNVSADVERPFVVSTEHAEITVVGTAFDVHAMGGLTKVSVTEGQVTIQGDSQQVRRLSAGQQALISSSATRVDDVEIDSIATWRTGQLVYKNVTLAEIVADLNRYLTKTIKIPDETLQRRRCVTSVLQLEDREAILDGLKVTCGISWKSLSDTIILITPAS